MKFVQSNVQCEMKMCNVQTWLASFCSMKSLGAGTGSDLTNFKNAMIKRKGGNWEVGWSSSTRKLKGIVHHFFFYCSNLIFWIVMGYGIAAQGTSTRGAMGPGLKSMAPRVEVPCGAASRGPWGQNENPKMLSFGRL